MRGIRLMRRGMDWRVSGTKGGSSRSFSNCSSSTAEERVLVESEGCVVENVDCGAGAVEGRMDGLGSGGSREVVRRVKAGCETGVGAVGATIGAANCSDCFFSCCSTSRSFCLGELCFCLLGPSWLNGRRCSVGGGSGFMGEMSLSIRISGLKVGDGVISGVVTSFPCAGMGGAGR